jgi:hypothetical protein
MVRDKTEIIMTYLNTTTLLGLLDTEDEGTMTPQNIMKYSPNDTLTHYKRHKYSATLL